MREIVLQQFFQDSASADELALDVSGSVERRGNDTRVHIERMTSEFLVEARHLVRVCDAVLEGTLEPENLVAIGFALQSSDAFVWDGSTRDGERVGETTADWCAPEINFPLTIENVLAWKSYLTSGNRERLRPVLAG